MMTVHAWTDNYCQDVIYECNVERELKHYPDSVSYASECVFVLLQMCVILYE